MFLLRRSWRLLFLSIKSIQSNALKPSKNTLNLNITKLLSLIPLSSTSIIIFFQEDSKINLEIPLGDLSKHFMISQVFIPHRSLHKLNLSAQKKERKNLELLKNYYQHHYTKLMNDKNNRDSHSKGKKRDQKKVMTLKLWQCMKIISVIIN